MKKFIERIKRGFREIRIRRDIKGVMNLVLELEMFSNKNFEVTKENYLNPKKGRAVLPLSHPDGLSVYYNGILMGLEYLIKNGYSNIKIMQSHPPDYVRAAVRAY